MNQIEEIKSYIDQKEKETSVWQLDESLESLWLDVKVSSWLKNDEKLLDYAQMYLKEPKSIRETIKIPFLELKASITCPYFDDFKNFMKELKQWNNNEEVNNNTEVIDDTHEFIWKKVSDIKSQPFYKNASTGVTRCSATAKFNWLDFGVELPSWDAYDAWSKVPSVSSYNKTIPDWKKTEKPNSNWPAISIDSFLPSDDSNFADIYIESSSDYGHRAIAFKDNLWQWYILDPYTRVNWILDDSPKKLQDYISQRKILKSNFYTSAWYSPQERQYT